MTNPQAKMRELLSKGAQQFRLLERLAQAPYVSSQGKRVPKYQAIAEEAKAAAEMFEAAINTVAKP